MQNVIDLENVIYTAQIRTAGGRDGGTSRISDGRQDATLSALGTAVTGTSPEQLFAAGWPACYLSAVKLVARKMKLPLPDDLAVDAEGDLGPAGPGYALAVRFNVSMPGVDRDAAQRLPQAAHDVCPYSRASRGNIEVATNLA